MPEAPKAILFDVGNVLLRLKSDDFLTAFLAACPAQAAETVRREMREGTGLHFAYERGELSAAEFHAQLRNTCGLTWSFDEWLRRWNDYFLPNRPMEVLIAKLQGQLRFWALSNTNAEHFATFKRDFRLFDSFEGIIGSQECGLRKPDIRIYQLALRRMELPPHDVVFIDDLQPNIDAAKGLGMRVFHYSFNDLELKAYLREMGLNVADWQNRPSPFAC